MSDDTSPPAPSTGSGKTPAGALRALRPLLAQLSPRRWRQLRLTVGLMVLGGIAEMVSLAAVLVFLALLSGGSGGGRVAGMFEWLGWPPGESLVIPAVVLLILTGVAATAIRMVLTWVSNKFVMRVGHDIGVAIYARMLQQPYSAHVQRNTSEVISGIEKVNGVVLAVLLPIMQSIVSAIVSFFIIVALLAIDYMAALLAGISIAIPYIIVSFATRRVLRANSETLAASHTQRIKQLQEGLGGIRDILLDQSQPIFEEAFRKLDDAYRRAQTVNVFVAAAPRYVVEFAGIVLIALLALFMSTQPGGLVAAIPVLGAMALGAQRLLPLVHQVYYGWSNLVASGQVIADVMSLLQAPVMSRRPRDKSAAVVPFQRDIVLDGVAFVYPGGGRPALHSLDLQIARGERIGFLGETGSGKSTLLDLIMGLLEPTRGEMRIDGVPLGDANVADWQAQIAHVPQFIYLADGSIAANIAFGDPPESIDLDRARIAAERAQIADFVEALPEGYGTSAGERGVRLSGGQRQRIGIARAFYRNRKVFVFDEATSALDDETEAAVMASVAALGRDVTVLMIAHRLSTLASCDRVVRMLNGRIAQIGTYEHMVRNKSGQPLASRGALSGADR